MGASEVSSPQPSCLWSNQSILGKKAGSQGPFVPSTQVLPPVWC